MIELLFAFVVSAPAQNMEHSAYADCFGSLERSLDTLRSADGEKPSRRFRTNLHASGQMGILSPVRTEGREDVVDFYLVDWKKRPITGVKTELRFPTTRDMKTGGTAGAKLGSNVSHEIVLRNQPQQEDFDQRVSLRFSRSSAFGLMLQGFGSSSGGTQTTKIGPNETELDAAKMKPLSTTEIEKLIADQFEDMSKQVRQPIGAARPCFRIGSQAFRERLSAINAKYSSAPAPSAEPAGSRSAVEEGTR